MSKALTLYRRLSGWPAGKYLFSRAVCLAAPYFRTIRPRFRELKPGYCEISLKKRRGVHNHLKSVHAIAMCNLCELAGGMALDVTLPGQFRWIPKGMEVQYLRIARSDLRGVCAIPADTQFKPGSLPVTVSVRDSQDTEVMRAVIAMHISENK